MIYAPEYDPNSEPEPACDAPDCHDLLEQDLLGDWFCPTCAAKKNTEE